MRVFTAAPHRMMFFTGSAQLVLLMLFWSTEMLGRYTSLWEPLTLTIPATHAHIFLMMFGLFIFFIFGFLMTTYPRWMSQPAIEKRHYAPPFWLLSAAVLLFYAGLFFHRYLIVIGVLLLLAGWGLGCIALFRVYRAARGHDRRYETSLNTALVFGWFAVLLYLSFLLSGQPLLLQGSQTVGIWLFLLPLIVSVCHRMIPFFTSCVLRDYTVVQPMWALPLLWLGVITHAVLERMGVVGWLWLPDLLLAGIAFYHIARWGLLRSFEVRLLAVLHLAFLWFGIAMLLFTLQSAASLLGTPLLGLAPLHALTIGFFSSLIIAMVTRVTLGHSGRSLELDRYTWLLFLGINLTALLRIANEIHPLAQLTPYWNPLAAFGWLLCTALWVGRYAPMYLRPRVDGKPG